MVKRAALAALLIAISSNCFSQAFINPDEWAESEWKGIIRNRDNGQLYQCYGTDPSAKEWGAQCARIDNVPLVYCVGKNGEMQCLQYF